MILISMASVGLDTGGSQFYISLSPNTHMNGRCVVFGRMDPAGEPILAAIEKVATSRCRSNAMQCNVSDHFANFSRPLSIYVQVFTFRGVPSTDVVIKASGVL